ncbi:MAG: phosphotransferase [Dehalococcoidia bacterium]|nr:phosphotransferase [Dehalococcoidia bacterium]
MEPAFGQDRGGTVSNAIGASPAPLTEELKLALQTVLDAHFRERRPIVRLERQASAYRSSFALEQLLVTLGDGSALTVIFKDLGWRSLAKQAHRAKPDFLYDPLREIRAYEALLAPNGLGALCYGSLVAASGLRFWLFLEKVDGVELYQVGELETWKAVAVWLAEVHRYFFGRERELVANAPLLNHDRRFYGLWAARALEFADAHKGKDSPRLRGALQNYETVIDRLLALPRTFLHGEFFASNVLVKVAADHVDVYPVDWELAAIGPGLTDLAALVAGDWSEDERGEIAQAYFEALGRDRGAATSRDDLREALLCCRLQTAVQRLGWSREWVPPEQHAHDWLTEAVQLAGDLKL